MIFWAEGKSEQRQLAILEEQKEGQCGSSIELRREQYGIRWMR